MFWRKNRKISEIEFDEIFLDSRNIPDYRKESFEGMVEKPIPQKNVFLLGGFLAVFAAVFILRIFVLEIVRGEEFYQRAEKNRLEVVFEDAERGLIYDRMGEALAKNSEIDGKNTRVYPSEGFLHILGFLTRNDPGPEKKNFGVGASGLEANYEEILKGSPKKTEREKREEPALVVWGRLFF